MILALGAILITLAVLTVVMVVPIPIEVAGHGVSFAGLAVLAGEPFLSVLVVMTLALIVLEMFFLAQTKRTSDRSGDAGGHYPRRTSPALHRDRGLNPSTMSGMVTGAVISMMAIWSAMLRSFDRPQQLST